MGVSRPAVNDTPADLKRWIFVNQNMIRSHIRFLEDLTPETSLSADDVVRLKMLAEDLYRLLEF